MNNIRKQSGFTLIELMIVIAILAILMAIAIPAYQDYTIRSQVSECMNLAGGARTAVAEFWVNDGTWPADNAEAGLAASGTIVGSYVSDVEVAEGVISCTLDGADAHQEIAGGIMILDPTVATAPGAGSVDWECRAGAGLEARYLPRACR
jgi:type IV pilus assembly protein PilA